MTPKFNRPAYTLSPIQEASFHFCAKHALNNKAWAQLNAIMQAAFEGQESLDYHLEQEREKARTDMEKLSKSTLAE